MRFLSGRTRFAKTLIAATAVVVAATAGVFVGVGVANAVATDTLVQNPAIKAIQFSSNTAQTVYTSPSWTTVASQFATTLQGANQVLVRFSAQSRCQAGSTDGWCSIRVLINGNEAAPADGTNFVWQWEGSNETWGARSIDRFTNIWVGTSITVTVQAALRGGATQFRIQDWALTTIAY